MEKPKNPAAVALGRLGGQRNVPKGLAMLTPEERSAIAKKGAAKRWGKKTAAKKAGAAKKSSAGGS
jgi:hypothetical protein